MLSDKLTMLQDFPSNPALLKGALDRYIASASALARAPSDNNIDTVVAAASQHDIQPAAGGAGAPDGTSGSDPGVPSSSGGSNSSIADDIAYMMRRFEKEAENF